MSYKFPHFDDIPNPELIQFHFIDDITKDHKYCNQPCSSCIFDDGTDTCSALTSEHRKNREALLEYVKANHPEYLL